MFEEVLQKLYTIDHIPSLQLIKDHMVGILEDAGTEKKDYIDELSRYISYDPSLTIEFLKIANSDSFGFKSKISSINHALLILDYDLIRLIIEQHPVIPNLRMFDSLIKNDIIKLIKHSIEVRLIVKNLLTGFISDRFPDKDSQDELLSAAALHDIGLFFLMIYFPEEYHTIYDKMRKSRMVQRKEVDDILLPEHSLISSVLCEVWNLPNSIKASIAFHHFPWAGNERYKLEAEILYLADNISSSFYEIFYDDDDIYTVEEHIVMQNMLLEIIEKLGIDMRIIAMLRIHSVKQSQVIFSEMGI